MTGAPIAGTRTASMINGLGFESYIFCAHKPSDQFLVFLREIAPEVQIVNDFTPDQFDAYICHSAACWEIANQLINANCKVAWWIHEDTHFFDVVDGRSINNCLERSTALVFASNHCAYRTFGAWVWRRKGYGIHVIPNFIGYRRTARKYFEKPVIAHVATLSINKGTDTVIQLARITEEMGWKFHLIGRTIAANLLAGIPKNITLHGELQPDEVSEVMGDCSHLFHPSRLDNQPLVIIEAIAIGLPVISSTLPSIQAYAKTIHGVHCFNEAHFNWLELINSFTETINSKTILPTAFNAETHKSLLRNLIIEIMDSNNQIAR